MKLTKSKYPHLQEYEIAYFASGCFWCIEAIYESVDGVVETISGYAGGDDDNPTYKKVGSGESNHAEAVAVFYDKNVVSYETLVKVYLNSKDNVNMKCQGPDCGDAYRSILFFSDKNEEEIAVKTLNDFIERKEIPKNHNNELKRIGDYYVAEEYHQNFEKLNPKNSYIRAVSIPRLNRFKNKMPNVLKKNYK